MTSCIGCRYILIDSLCIIQRDEIDWRQQSLEVADIYMNSYLNLATIFLASSTDNLFTNRQCFVASNSAKQMPADSLDISQDLAGQATHVFTRYSQWLTHKHILDEYPSFRS